MNNRRFPLQRLPNDVCSEVLKTMEHPEIIAYSLTSKKALSLVQSLRLPLRNARIRINKWPDIQLDFGHISVLFKFKMGKNGKEMKRIADIPRKIYVSTVTLSQEFRPKIESKAFTCSNPRMAVGEWIRLICSIFRFECYEAHFSLRSMRYDVQSLRNTFPKLRKVIIFGSFRNEANDKYIQNAQTILRVFSPYVENVHLCRIPLQENFSIQHIGMVNLKELKLYAPRNMKLSDLSILNVKRCVILESHFSLRDLNRFFKLWRKGSYPKLKYLLVHGKTIADWNVLMRGLNAAEEEAEGDEKKYIIQNCYGIRARIEPLNLPFVVNFRFIVCN